MSSNEQKFKYDSNYKQESSFTRVKFGHDMPVLETELNEAQILQEKARTSLTRRMVPSGFVEMVEKEFDGPAILYNPIENSVNKFNHIALAPCRAIINGYELTMEGNFTYDGRYNNYILIDLEDAPNEGKREDLVYLEVWFQVLSGNDNVREYGFRRGNPTGYIMMDPRVNGETSRRIAMCWDIKIAKGINFNQYPDGLGYVNIMNYSNVVGEANGSLTTSPSLVYMSACDDIFKGCEFYKDSNLYVAGRPNTPITSSSIYGNYIFAMPLFKVIRRNKQRYSIKNFNGSISYNSVYSDSSNNSDIQGDLQNNIRPDKLYYDVIHAHDILDLRKTIDFKEFNQHYYLDKTIKDLFTGNLQTKEHNKMRRVQFGVPNVSNINEEMVKFNATFDNTLEPSIKGVTNPTFTVNNNTIIYKDSLNSYGLFIDGTNYVKYNLPVVSGEGATLNVNRGTIDFYFQPYWSGPDANISQKIFNISDMVGNTVFEFYKEGSYLKWRQYFDPTVSSEPIQVDLSNTPLMAKNIYHIRLSWCSDESEAFANIYINGKKVAPNLYQPNTLDNRDYILQIGDVEDTDTLNALNGTGFVIENLIIYNAIFENELNDNIKWPGLPLDVIYGDSLLLPSFNSKLSNFSDNGYSQITTTILEANGEPDTENKTYFTFNISYDKFIDTTKEIKVYDISSLIKGGNVEGTWSGLDTNSALFTTIAPVTKVLVQYNLIATPGNGGYDLPNEILSAGIVNNNEIISEVSYCRKGAEQPRQVPYLKARLINGIYDTAYDYPSDRNTNQCFARMLEYHLPGNGTNEYNIPRMLYGYEVIGILEVVNRKLVQCTKLEDGILSFNLKLKDRVLNGDVIKFKLALGGIGFDYETQTKTLVSNIYRTKILEFTANGNDDEYIIPAYDNTEPLGGIIKASLTFMDNEVNNIGRLTGEKTEYKICLINNEMFSPVYQVDPLNPANNQLIGYKLATYTLQQNVDSFGTPFLRIKLDDIPADGDIIKIPVLVTYQPPKDINLSIWYNYIPYQGILSNKSKKLKRMSDWKYFTTTLSSGNINFKIEEDNIYSLNNVINRLPGGMAYAYSVDGKSIAFEYVSNMFTNTKINHQLAFVNDVFFANNNDNSLDNAIFPLDTEFTIYKSAKGFQDGGLVIQNKDFSVFLPNGAEAVNKYLGMACLVIDENGELLLFVIGDLISTPTTTNKLAPIYGDLFKIQGIPTTIKF